MNFEEVAADWKAEKRRWVKDATYAVYIQHLNNYIIPFFRRGRRKPSMEQAQAFVQALTDKGLSPKSIHDIVIVARMILRHGERLKAWPHVDMDLHLPERGQKRPAVLAPADQRHLVEHLRANPGCRELGLLICLQAGLRIGELCGLQWQDIDLRTGTLRVRKTVQRIYLTDGAHGSSYVAVGTPKTPSSIREIPLSHELVRLLRPLRRSAMPDNYLLSNGPKPAEPRSYRAFYKRLLANLGIPQIRFHALRHTFATRCIESRCDYKTVSVILGHSSISTTLDLYVHPGMAAKKRVVEKVAKGM